MDILVTEDGEVAAIAAAIQDTGGGGFRLPDGAIYPPGLTLIQHADVPQQLIGKRLSYVNNEFAELQPIAPQQQVPSEIDALAGIVVLQQAGLGAAYEAWVTSNDRTMIEKETVARRGRWRRDNALLISAAAAIGITSEQLDQMFIAASKINL